MKIAFLVTTHNRMEKTKACINSVVRAISYAASRGIQIERSWYVTDAGSSDDTVEMLAELNESNMHICVVNKDTYYSMGMRNSMVMWMKQQADEKSEEETSLVMLINDDVLFYEDFLVNLLERNEKGASKVIVGATDHDGVQSYGGIRYNCKIGRRKLLIPQKIRYSMVSVNDDNKSCHTFNANCVMIPAGIVDEVGVVDENYVHGLGDFDYGLAILRKGYDIETTDFYVGDCANNSKDNTWMDTGLSRTERVRKLNSVKGAPTRQWFYYLNKNFGLATALVYSITPYIRILLGK